MLLVCGTLHSGMELQQCRLAGLYDLLNNNNNNNNNNKYNNNNNTTFFENVIS